MKFYGTARQVLDRIRPGDRLTRPEYSRGLGSVVIVLDGEGLRTGLGFRRHATAEAFRREAIQRGAVNQEIGRSTEVSG